MDPARCLLPTILNPGCGYVSAGRPGDALDAGEGRSIGLQQLDKAIDRLVADSSMRADLHALSPDTTDDLGEM